MNRAARRQATKTSYVRGATHLPPEAVHLFQETVSHHQAKRFQQAQAGYDQILRQFPKHADSLHLRGLLAYQLGHYELAFESIQRAIDVDPTKALYFYNLALVLEKQDRWKEGIHAYRQALELNPSYVETYANLANLYRHHRQWPEAISTLQQALERQPQSADLHNHLGVTYKEHGDLENAKTHYQQALCIAPDHAESLNNLGIVLQEQGKLQEAKEAFQRALASKPRYAHAHYHLGLVELWQGHEEAALRCFSRSADLTYNHGTGTAPAFVTKARIKHDYEQWQYLAQYVTDLPIPVEYHQTLTTLRQRIDQSSSDSIFLKLNPQEQYHLAPAFNRFIQIRPTERIEGPAVNPSLDQDAIEQQYFSTTPEAMYVDALLTELALSGIRNFCLESTIWKRDYQNGYIGTFLANGFACPLLLQIAEELRTRFPRIFRQHQLQQAWAFKHDSAMRGLNMHADAAAVNVNFWITPNEGNRNPESGGLVVWDKEAPDHWDFAEYNDEKNREKIQEYLKESGAQPITIPHRQNRAIIFNSNLFHETDSIDFRDTYESRRINVTLLYGHRQKAR